MRVLLACSLGGSGHLTPVVDVARTVGRLGHDAVVLVPPSLAAEIEREGLPYEVGGEPPRAVIDETWQRVRAGPAEAVVGLIDRELFADHCHGAVLPEAQGGISQAYLEWGVLDMVSPTIERFGSGVASAIAQAPYLSAFPASLDPSPWSDTRRFRQPEPTSRGA